MADKICRNNANGGILKQRISQLDAYTVISNVKYTNIFADN